MDEGERSISIQRYSAMLQYLAYENTTYWTRAQFFLLANAALVAFVFNTFPTTSLDKESNIHLSLLMVGTVVGFLLTLLWLDGLRAGQRWISHWTEALKEWEQSAMDRDLFRNPPPGKASATRVARRTAWLFLFLWLFSALFILCCFIQKSKQIGLP